jgi:uncharacterized protein (TIGR03435 family)
MKILASQKLVLLGALLLARPHAFGAQGIPPRLMTTDGRPMEFEVVSVRPNHSGAEQMNIMSPPMSNGVTITNMPLVNILQWACGITMSDQIVGLPGWATEDRYDIAAKVANEDVTAFRKVVDPIQRAPMLQKILVERFNLKFHNQAKDLTVYALLVARGGVRMTEIQPAIAPNGMKDGGSRQRRRGQIKSMGQPMQPLIDVLTMELKRVVVDRTDLKGFYNFTLTWTPDDVNASDAHSNPEEFSAPPLVTALQDQLGLKLERSKAPVQVLVVDHVERPSEN